MTIEKVGAVATAGGFLALALIDNPSGQTATEVKVDMASVAAGGQILTRRSGTVRLIGPRQRAALALAFPVGRTLPAQFTASVASLQWSGSSAPDSAEVTGSTLLQDARTPTVRVHLVDHAGGAVRVAVTTVCWDGGGNIRGGGTETLIVNPDPAGKDATVPVALSAIPARCDGFAVPLT